MRIGWPVVLALLASAPRGAARAAEHEVRFDAAAAFAPPVPMPGVGLAYVLAPGPRLALEAGVEWRFVAHGGQAWVLPRLRFGSLSAGLGVEAGWIDSTGPSQQPLRGSGRTLSLRAELLGYEARFASGLALGASLGLGIGLHGPRFCVVECHPGDEDRDWAGAVFPSLRLSAGYWF